jgi:16S rRNA C967 or C1407 C5-methylase (RsmB/RsmF family)/NOL1/NOP2/fmu family ribosome biogenesis protein
LKLPSALIDSLQNTKGFDEKSFKQVHESGEQITSIRFNPGKNILANPQQATLQKVPWSSQGYYLATRPSFTSDPLFHAGNYYVQEASSMFLEEVVKQTCDLRQPLRVLDLCAAPGGKSTLIQSIISENSLLVSNELIKSRVSILAENISKWGAINVIITNNDPAHFQKLPGYFDLVVVDAPCSGSGLFRKDPDAISEWSLNNVELCSQRQQRILADILPSLKPGGILIYATCSYSESEDEEICDWLMSNSRNPVTGIRLQTNNEWNIVETNSPLHKAYGYRFFPDKLKGEGFFIAAFKKEGTASNENKARYKNKLPLLSNAGMEIIGPYIKNTEALSFFTWQEDIIAVPDCILNDISFLQSFLYIKKAGLKIGNIIREELIPDHEFALSNLLADSIPSISVDATNALQYLRRQEPEINTGLKGWVLIKYQNAGLGWVKVLANRINNYYPKAWRILNK